jgi:hypothetical protein
MPGVHVAHFRRMCLTARNSLRHPKSPIMPRTSPTRFDAWSSRGGRLEWTMEGHPHVLSARVVASEGARGTDGFHPRVYPLVKHTNSAPSRAGAPACGPRRAVRVSGGDAAAPFR